MCLQYRTLKKLLKVVNEDLCGGKPVSCVCAATSSLTTDLPFPSDEAKDACNPVA